MLKSSRLLPLFLLLTSVAVGSRAQTSASATWQVTKYDLIVTLPATDNGRVVTIRALLLAKNVSAAPASSLTLRISPSAEVTAVTVNGVSVDPSKAEEKTATGTTLQRVGLRIPSVPSGGQVTAVVDYKLTVKENAALATLSPASAVFLPQSFWYPTPNSWFFVKGADVAPVKITVNSNPSSSATVVAAGAGIMSGGAGSSRSEFDSGLAGQPFLVAGPLDVVNENGVAVFVPRNAVGESQKRAAELASLLTDARTFMAGLLGPAPQVPLKIVAGRRGAGFASGGTVIVDDAVFRRPKIDALTAMNIAEAAAKMWLGGSIVVNGDGHGVIAEGLSRYLATQFIESKYGKDVADIERMRQRNSYAAVSRRDTPMAQVSPADDFYYPVVANKGAMVWRILAKRVGAAEFSNIVKTNAQDGVLTLGELREGFVGQKDLVDYFFDKVTDMDLMAGVPQQAGADWRVALRNTGPADVTVDVAASTADGDRITAPATIRATSFGEIIFKTPKKVVRAEVDADKLYPQADYSDDVAPRTTTDSDPLLAAKRLFDKQDFAGAESAARTLLVAYPRSDELRVTLGRTLLAQGKNPEAQREFQAVLDEKLPAARSIAWANAGLAEIAAAAGQPDAVSRYATAAILSEGEYGASLAARAARSKANVTSTDPTIKAFFAEFDKAAAANRKADVEALTLSGEAIRFASGVAGAAQAWQTSVRNVDRLDASTVLVEADVSIRLINKEPESETAVYRLVKTAGGWKLAGVEVFETK